MGNGNRNRGNGEWERAARGTCTCPTGQITNDRRGMDAAIGWPKMKSLTPKIINEVGPINRRRLTTKTKKQERIVECVRRAKGSTEDGEEEEERHRVSE